MIIIIIYFCFINQKWKSSHSYGKTIKEKDLCTAKSTCNYMYIQKYGRGLHRCKSHFSLIRNGQNTNQINETKFTKQGLQEKRE